MTDYWAEKWEREAEADLAYAKAACEERLITRERNKAMFKEQIPLAQMPFVIAGKACTKSGWKIAVETQRAGDAKWFAEWLWEDCTGPLDGRHKLGGPRWMCHGCMHLLKFGW